MQGHPRKNSRSLGHIHPTSRRKRATTSQIHKLSRDVTQRGGAKRTLYVQEADWWPSHVTATQDGQRTVRHPNSISAPASRAGMVSAVTVPTGRQEPGFRDYLVRGKASSPPCLKLAQSRCPSGRKQRSPGHSPAGQSYYEEQNSTNVQLVPEVAEVQGRHLLQPTAIGIIEELLRRPQLGRPASPSPSP